MTHSDTLLREALGNPKYSVYHMTSATQGLAPGENQARPVAEDEFQAALLDLVGDLAAYQPTAKVVIFEGSGDSGFDVSTVQRLFPLFAEKVNLVSGNDKRSVIATHRALSLTARQTGMQDRFYAITDRDFDNDFGPEDARILSWDVYHIENYLLVPKYLLQVYRDVTNGRLLSNEQDVLTALKDRAEAAIDRLVLQIVQDKVNSSIIANINIGARPDSRDPARDLTPSLEASLQRITTTVATLTSGNGLQALSTETRERFQGALDDGSWIDVFPGRPILRRFVADYFEEAISYQGTVNLVVSKMVADKYEPLGMKQTLQRVVSTL